MCITDMRLPDGDGLELLQAIQLSIPKLPVIVITAHGSADTAVRAMKQGAFDFLSKPVDLKGLRQLVSNALKTSFLSGHDRRSRDILLGESEIMRAVRAQINKIARSQAPFILRENQAQVKRAGSTLNS